MCPGQATCIRRHCVRRQIRIQIHVASPGYMFPGDMCPGVDAALALYFDTRSKHHNIAKRVSTKLAGRAGGGLYCELTGSLVSSSRQRRLVDTSRHKANGESSLVTSRFSAVCRLREIKGFRFCQ